MKSWSKIRKKRPKNRASGPNCFRQGSRQLRKMPRSSIKPKNLRNSNEIRRRCSFLHWTWKRVLMVSQRWHLHIQQGSISTPSKVSLSTMTSWMIYSLTRDTQHTLVALVKKRKQTLSKTNSVIGATMWKRRWTGRFMKHTSSKTRRWVPHWSIEGMFEKS